MKRFFSHAIFMATFFCAISTPLIHSHGFSQSTLVKMAEDGWSAIKQLYETPSSKKQYVLGYDQRIRRQAQASVSAAAENTVNCYCEMWFDTDTTRRADIQCTPVQEFYSPEKKAWVPAYKLKVGDKLLSNCTNPIAITRIQLVRRPLKVYLLKIKHIHTYLVSGHNILTHNFTLPAPSFALSIFREFGAGAAAGGAAGSQAGPWGCVITAGVLGLVAVGKFLITGDTERTSFHTRFEAQKFAEYIKSQAEQQKAGEKGKPSDEKPKEEKPKSGEKGKSSEEKPKADDGRETGAQAPGMPREEDGYIPPKKWDGEKVPTKNKKGPIRRGYPDENGKIWVPSGPNGHGGPHWDVQYPNGDYDNVYPGGKIRPGRKL